MKATVSNNFQFDYGSDIHEEFYDSLPDWKNLKNPNSEILILAGDNANTAYGVKHVINDAQKYYKHVLYVPGNHDFYDTHQTRLSMPENPYKVYEKMNFWSRMSKIEGWTWLPDTDFVLGNTVFIGQMGWYDFNHPDYSWEVQKSVWKRYMADSRFIHFDDNVPAEDLAENDVYDLSEKIKKYDIDENIKHIVVITHTLPVIEALIIKPGINLNEIVWNQLSGSFYNSSMQNVYTLSKKVNYWIFGHTHSKHDFMKEHTRFLCHPRAYPHEGLSEDWKPQTIII